MTHDDVRDRLGDYLEGDLDVGERAAVDAHLSSCSSCREELRGLRETVALLRALPEPEPSPTLADRVMAGIEAERGPRGLRGGFRRFDVGQAAGVLAAGFAGLALLSWSLQPDGPAEAGRAQPQPGIASLPDNAAGDAAMWIRRPPVVELSPAARTAPRFAARADPRIAAFSGRGFRGGGVAPMKEIDELPGGSASNRERELDRQLARLLGDPGAFLLRMGPDVRGERFARLAQHAARRGQAGRVARRLISVPHPLADALAPRFLAASLAVDLERRQGRLE